MFDKDGEGSGVSRWKLDPCAARISRGVPSLDYRDFSILTRTRDDVVVHSGGDALTFVRELYIYILAME